jgi:hypothetical protein
MVEMTCDTFWARIYIAGPIEVAKQLLRAECMREGLCVTIEPTHFLYTGAEESGYVVGLVNYPRFPSTPEALHERAVRVLHLLLDGTHQHSAMLMEPNATYWYSKREGA